MPHQQTAEVGIREPECKGPCAAGHPVSDNWAKQDPFEASTLEKMATVPIATRTRCVFDVVEKRIENPNAWISKRYSKSQLDQRAVHATRRNRFGDQINR